MRRPILKIKILLFMLIGVLPVSSAAVADTISNTGTWYQLISPTDTNGTGLPFFNNGTSDPGSANIGKLIIDNNYITDPYFYASNPSKSAVNVSFSGAGGYQHYDLTLTIAGFALQNKLYLYDTTAPGDTTKQQIIFDGQEAPTTKTITSNIPNNYGFLLVTPQGNSFYSGGGVNGSEDGHFAFFESGNSTNTTTWWFGVEDLLLCGSDKDFQDMFVKFEVTPSDVNVPLPPSAFLLGSGLLGLAGLRRFRKS
jgi:hypothetical protein